MKKALILSLILVAGFVQAADLPEAPAANPAGWELLKPQADGEKCAARAPTTVAGDVGHQDAQGQGCCSSHGGECGCSVEGRTICCDGVTSPSCKC